MKFGHKSFTNSGIRRDSNVKLAALAGTICYPCSKGKIIVDSGNKTFFEGPNDTQRYALSEIAGINVEVLKAELEKNNKAKVVEVSNKKGAAVAAAAVSGNTTIQVASQV